MEGLAQGASNPMFEEWHCRRRGAVEGEREGGTGETDCERVRVAFGENREGHKTGSEASARGGD